MRLIFIKHTILELLNDDSPTFFYTCKHKIIMEHAGGKLTSILEQGRTKFVLADYVVLSHL